MLFEEYKYFDYQFPEPQYLGAKHMLLPFFTPKQQKSLYRYVVFSLLSNWVFLCHQK